MQRVVSLSDGLSANHTGTTVELFLNHDVVQRRVDDACAANEAVRVVNADGTVMCTPLTDTPYSAGQGLLLNSTTFTVDPSAVQLRVDTACGGAPFLR